MHLLFPYLILSPPSPPIPADICIPHLPLDRLGNPVCHLCVGLFTQCVLDPPIMGACRKKEEKGRAREEEE